MMLVFVIRIAITTVACIFVLAFLAIAALALLTKAVVVALWGAKGQAEVKQDVPARPFPQARNNNPRPYTRAGPRPEPDSECPYYLTSEGKVNYAAPRFPRPR